MHGNFAPTTVADGRLQTVADAKKRPPNVKREPFATHSGKMDFEADPNNKHFGVN